MYKYKKLVAPPPINPLGGWYVSIGGPIQYTTIQVKQQHLKLSDTLIVLLWPCMQYLYPESNGNQCYKPLPVIDSSLHDHIGLHNINREL